MRIELPYGTGTRVLTAPSGAGLDYISPDDTVPGVEDVDAALAEACASPVESSPLGGRVGSESSVLIVVSDLTRSAATRALLPALVVHLESLGVRRDALSVLVARGTHRSLSREEKKFFRQGPLKGLSVAEHDCDDNTASAALMLTRRGTPVRINRAVRDVDLAILLSPVSFHYFAGYGGGRKMILPGCADRAAILANHRLSLSDRKPVTLHPSCRPGNLDGNPVHEDMLEAAQALTNLFAVNFFNGADGRLLRINAGDVTASHEEACKAYASHFRVASAQTKVAVASAGGWPGDINLLQSHKALFHTSRMLSDDAAVLLYAECAEGIGSESLAAAIAKPRDKFLRTAFDDYALNNQTAVSLLGMTARFRVAMVTELPDEVLEQAGIERCLNAEAWLAEALEAQDAERLSVVRHASCTLPVIEKE